MFVYKVCSINYFIKFVQSLTLLQAHTRHCFGLAKFRPLDSTKRILVISDITKDHDPDPINPLVKPVFSSRIGNYSRTTGAVLNALNRRLISSRRVIVKYCHPKRLKNSKCYQHNFESAQEAAKSLEGKVKESDNSIKDAAFFLADQVNDQYFNDRKQKYIKDKKLDEESHISYVVFDIFETHIDVIVFCCPFPTK